jgi:RecA-family ATPase
MSAAEDFYAEAKANEQHATPAPWESRVTVVPQEWYAKPAPPRRWLLRDSRHQDEGVFPLGKVGLLAAEGGAGKTMLVVQLALAVATGTRWIGTFDVPTSGKVLLALGEEDGEEVHRRVHRAAHQTGVTPPEGAIVTLPLTGMTCPMVEDGDDGAFLVWLREFVATTGPYALIVVDPVSRFCGQDAERDNAAGTRFCQALESLVEPSGGASVLGSHHVNKQSRGSGASVDASSARGASALVDGVRWVSTVGVEHIPGVAIDTVLTFAVAKTNYSKKPPPVQLRYSDGGVLVPLDEDDRKIADKARNEADPKAKRERKREEAKSNRNIEVDAVVIACVTASPGIGAADLRVRVKAKAGCGPDAADTAIARMIEAQCIRRTDGKTKKHYIVETETEADSNSMTCASNGVHAPSAVDHDMLDMV